MDLLYVPLIILMSCKYLLNINIVQISYNFIINSVYFLREISRGLTKYTITKLYTYVCNPIESLPNEIKLALGIQNYPLSRQERPLETLGGFRQFWHDTHNSADARQIPLYSDQYRNPNLKLDPDLIYNHENYCNGLMHDRLKSGDNTECGTDIEEEEIRNINRQFDVRRELDDMDLTRSEMEYDAVHMKQKAGIRDTYDLDDDGEVIDKLNDFRNMNIDKSNEVRVIKTVKLATPTKPRVVNQMLSTDSILQKINNNLTSMLDDKRNEKIYMRKMSMVILNAYITAITNGNLDIGTIIKTVIIEAKKNLQDEELIGVFNKIEQFIESTIENEHKQHSNSYINLENLHANFDLNFPQPQYSMQNMQNIDNLKPVDYYESKKCNTPRVKSNKCPAPQTDKIEMKDFLEKLTNANLDNVKSKQLKMGENKIPLLRCSDDEVKSITLKMLPVSSGELREITLKKLSIGRGYSSPKIITHNIPPDGKLDLTENKKMFIIYRDGYTKLFINVPNSATIEVKKVKENNSGSDDSYDIIDEEIIGGI